MEILVAITILAFLMTNVYTIISNTTDSKDTIIKEDREKIQLEFALERITQDFEQIYSPLFHHSIIDPKRKVSEDAADDFDRNEERGFEPSERFPLKTYRGHLVPAFDSEQKHSIAFMTASHRRRLQNAKQSRYAWVLYDLRSPTSDEENDRAGDVLIRKSVSENIFDGDQDWDSARGYALLKNVKSLEFQFWSDDRKKFVASPRELNEKKNEIRMIQVKLTWVAPDETEHEITRTIRSLWPFYDVKKDEKLIREAFQRGNGGTFSNNGENQEGGVEDENF